MANVFHALEPGEVANVLATDAMRGLSSEEARARLERAGPNRVGDYRARPLWRLEVDQFRSLVVRLLLAAAAVAWGLDEHAEAVAILAALALNAAIGAASEWRARRSLDRLRALAVPRALVRREDRTFAVPSADLVPGDLIVLEAGAHVPADARLVTATALRVNEAALTGESFPVPKDAHARLVVDAPLPERPTMVYLGTGVLAGAGTALVSATGLATEQEGDGCRAHRAVIPMAVITQSYRACSVAFAEAVSVMVRALVPCSSLRRDCPRRVRGWTALTTSKLLPARGRHAEGDMRPC